MSQKQKPKEIAAWEIELARRTRARTARGIPEHVKDEDLEHYHKAISDARKLFDLPPAPAMPVVQSACTTCEGLPVARDHQDKIVSIGYASSDWFALIHAPIPIHDATRIPKAKEALDK